MTTMKEINTPIKISDDQATTNQAYNNAFVAFHGTPTEEVLAKFGAQAEDVLSSALSGQLQRYATILTYRISKKKAAVPEAIAEALLRPARRLINEDQKQPGETDFRPRLFTPMSKAIYWEVRRVMRILPDKANGPT